MLTGDNKATAKAIADQVGITEFKASLLPDDKLNVIKELQKEGEVVAMIGDGVNDAPALMLSDIGIAMGAIGTDVAIESADIVLIKSDLLDAVTAVQLSKATIRNIKQNLFWAFIYNTIGIPLASGLFFNILGWKLNPMFAGGAMSLSSVSVVSNALRLKFFKPVRTADDSDTSIEDYENKNKNNDGGNNMKKLLKVEGMSCGHCKMAVEKALKSVDGVEGAVVDLAAKTAEVTLAKEVENEVLYKAVTDAGYEVTEIN
jgi:Cu+-exporting ATPase